MKTIAEMRARLAEISEELKGISASADGSYSDEQKDQIDALDLEFENLSRDLETAEKVEKMKARTAAPAPRRTAPAAAPAATTRVEVGASATDKYGGFQSSGHFLMAAKEFATTGKRAEEFKNVMYEKSGEDGGFLVPEDISREIVKKLEDPLESLMARVRSTNVSSNSMSFMVDETNVWNGGVQAYWVGEGNVIPESKPSFGAAQMRLHKLGAMVKATDELLEDATALESYIKSAAPDAIMHKINNAILSGNGVGKPEGILNSSFTVTVPKESGQAADTIVAANIVKMYARMMPSSRARGVWLLGAGAAEEQLFGMKNSNGDYIYLQAGSGINQGPYSTLMGRPVIPMMTGLEDLGDKGDIIFADLNYYWMIKKAQLKQATSIHLHFDREITAFRFTMRVDGKVPFKTPVKTEKGTYEMSAFVNLASRT
jgi:HK97 family phage major capsid protein